MSPGVILPAVGGESPFPFSSALLFALTTWTITFLIESLLPLENIISWRTLSSSCTLTGGEGGTYHGTESWVICALLKAVQGYLVFFHLQKCRSFNALEKQHCKGATLAWERKTGSPLGRMNVQPQFSILGLQEENALCSRDSEQFLHQHIKGPSHGVLKPWGWCADFLVLL